MRIARQDGLRKLYHFQGKNLCFLKDILMNERVHFSNPQNFNDPWDCHPYFDLNAEDPENRREWGKRLERFYYDLPLDCRQKLEAQWTGTWCDEKPFLQRTVN